MSAETWAWGLATALFGLATITFTIDQRRADWRTRALKAEGRAEDAEESRDRWADNYEDAARDLRQSEALREQQLVEIQELRSRVIRPPMCDSPASCLQVIQAAHVVEHGEDAA